MALDEVAPLLAKYFVIEKIDTDRMIGGEEVLASYPRSKSQGIPWFVVLDGAGQELADSISAHGNVGCPYTDEEIADFGAILRQAVPELADADWKVLERSLVAQREKLEKQRR